MKNLLATVVVLAVCVSVTMAGPEFQAQVSKVTGNYFSRSAPARLVSSGGTLAASRSRTYLRFEDAHKASVCSNRMVTVPICACEAIQVPVPYCSNPVIEYDDEDRQVHYRGGKIEIDVDEVRCGRRIEVDFDD